MKKKWISVLAAMVLTTAAFAEDFPSYLIMHDTKVFGYKDGMPAELVIPEGVTEIDEDAFEDCLTLVSVTIPDTVVRIGECAFYGCENLKSVTIGKGVKSIGEGAFGDCTSLTSVTIPSSVTYIGECVFEECTSLKEIQFKGTMAQWKELDEYAKIPIPFIHCSDGNIGVKDVPVYLKMYGTVVTGCNDKVPANLVIPDGVTEIWECAFEKCTSLASVGIPGSVTKIGERAFEDCVSLASVVILEGVKEIGHEAFRGCTSLESVEIPKSVKEIGRSAFFGCKNIAVVTYKGSFKDWCAVDWDFWLFIYAKSIMLSDGTDLREVSEITASDLAGVTKIGESAFCDCKSLESVDIPKSVTKIGRRAFAGCKNIAVLTYKGSLKDWCAVDWDSSLIIYAKRIMLSDGTDPRKLTEIATNDLTGVRKIGESAFYGCKSLARVFIPVSVKEIGDGAFSGCTSLASVTIPRSVTQIGSYAFVNCNPNLKIHYDGTKAQWNAISKGNDLYPNIGTFTVQCSDGVVTEK
ncbi:MAG: leucine-rich repeat domain-containing protein [Treponemataceae bacterium]|nr:leucine-rich repeat domain-containing protein [Treponemataceae bacterium]